ncbi:VaFE repeat-containing surface-anchored protein [Candidatus Saccharibacteria bacterium]|nr:VaFE repeat-containing surface-anchored protein [Candidatus Saccharibacteria bacterium]
MKIKAFGLMPKMRIRKVVAGVLCLALFVSTLSFVIKLAKNNADVKAITSDGETITVDNGYRIDYGDWNTHKFTITTSSGNHTGFCSVPSKNSPNGQYKAQTVSGYNTILLAIYAYVHSNSYTDAFLDEYFSGITGDSRYAYVHAAIGYIYDGDLRGLNSAGRTKVQNFVRALNEEVQNPNSYLWAMAKNSKLYMIDPSTLNGKQEVMWIEDNYTSVSLTIQKCGPSETSCTPAGAASLEGVVFELDYNDQAIVYNPAKDEFYEWEGQVIASGETDNQGKVTFSNLPPGKYKIKETGSAMDNGLLVPLDNEPQQDVNLTSNTTITFRNNIVRGDVKFTKVDDNGRPMANIPFSIKSKTTGEKHIVVSDSNGLVDTSANQHDNGTNGYDEDESNPDNITYQGYGTWFGLDGSPIDNAVGALPYDTYEITELVCSRNEQCHDIESQKKTFTISSDSEVVLLGVDGKWENYCTSTDYYVFTVAEDDSDGDSTIAAEGVATVKDTINFCVPGDRSHVIVNKLMDKDTRQPVYYGGSAVQSSVEIEALGTTKNCGQIITKLSFDASEYAGHTLVLFAYIYEGDDIIYSHASYGNSDQTITVETPIVYSLGTSATDSADNDQVILAKSGQHIKDTVSYCLKAGTEYTIRGVLKDKSTGTDLKVNGQSIEKSVTFTPTSDCGTVELIYDINASSLGGKTIVVFEYAYEGNSTTPIVSHEKINDTAQTIQVYSLGTSAIDPTDRDRIILAEPGQKIQDTVSYCLGAGKTYTIKGILKDKATGQNLLINGNKVEKSTHITLDANTSCGQVKLTYDIDASKLAGKEIVVYEYAYEGNSTTPIVSHTNIDDKKQTVTVFSLGTTAVDASDKDNNIVAEKEQQILDTVNYCLKAGETYTIKGILKDKETGDDIKVNGKTIEQSTVITPTTNCGQVELLYDIDASELAGKEIVVFEYAYSGDEVTDGDEPIVKHEDLDDLSQTVVVYSLGTNATDAADNDKSIISKADQQIKDTVDYCLLAGKTYVIKGILKDKATGEDLKINGQSIEQSIEFTPETNCGQVELLYDIDASELAGKQIVVFEYAYERDETMEESDLILVVSHEDLDDENQTIDVYPPTPDTGSMSVPLTGGQDSNGSNYIFIVSAGTLLLAGCYFGYRLFSHHNSLKFD